MLRSSLFWRVHFARRWLLSTHTVAEQSKAKLECEGIVALAHTLKTSLSINTMQRSSNYIVPALLLCLRVSMSHLT